MAVIFCGITGCGKSTLGLAAAEALSLPFFDTDRLLEERYQKKIGEIWRQIGETQFRDEESDVIAKLEKKPSVIALGGGSLIREENRRRVKELGSVVYLKGSSELFYNRLLQKGLPAFLNPAAPYFHFLEISRSRSPIYDSVADLIIEIADRSVNELLDDILEKLNRGRGGRK